MNLNSSLKISSSGLTAERYRMDTISANIANANTIRTPQSPEWHRQDVIFSGDQNGVRVVGVTSDPNGFIKKYEPDHEYADGEGYVYYSNVDPLKEMVNMMSASRAYEANIEAFNSTKSMLRSALEIGKV
jgi:flagellar basal-body rod protein FlgC